MTTSLPPFVIFFAGALVMLPVRGWLQKILLLLVPVATGLYLTTLSSGNPLILHVAGYELVPFRVDRLSLLFGYLFTLAALIGNVFSLHLRDRLQHHPCVPAGGIC